MSVQKTTFAGGFLAIANGSRMVRAKRKYFFKVLSSSSMYGGCPARRAISKDKYAESMENIQALASEKAFSGAIC